MTDSGVGIEDPPPVLGDRCAAAEAAAASAMGRNSVRVGRMIRDKVVSSGDFKVRRRENAVRDAIAPALARCETGTEERQHAYIYYVTDPASLVVLDVDCPSRYRLRHPNPAMALGLGHGGAVAVHPQFSSCRTAVHPHPPAPTRTPGPVRLAESASRSFPAGSPRKE
jgi:hypothetical protein